MTARLIDHVMLTYSGSNARVRLLAGNWTELYESQVYPSHAHAEDIALRTACDLNSRTSHLPIAVKYTDHGIILSLPPEA